MIRLFQLGTRGSWGTLLTYTVHVLPNSKPKKFCSLPLAMVRHKLIKHSPMGITTKTIKIIL